MGVRCEEHVCITCGVPYTCPEAMIENQRKVGGYHSCPNGHQQGWDKDGSQNARLTRERDRLKQKVAELHDDVRRAQEAQAETMAMLARHKKRSAAGLCPCCNRTFSNMTRHMKTKHPDYNVVPLKAVKA